MMDRPREAQTYKQETAVLAMPQPRISIVIPVLNEEKLLAQTLEVFSPALRHQYGLEVIVSDGGSTDNTLVLAEQYADVIVRHTAPRRQTIAEGRNAGAARAEGVVLVFINGDTRPAAVHDFLETVTRWASKHGVRDAAECALACSVEIAPAERLWSDWLFHGLFNRYVRMLNWLGYGMGRGECQIVRSEDFWRVGGYNAQIAAGEDFDLYKRLASTGRIGWHKATLVYESPRRFRRFGYLHVLWMWMVNAVSVIVRKKAVSETWELVR